MESESKETSEFDAPAHVEKRPNKCVKFLKTNWLMLATILGVGVGFGIAFGVRAAKPNQVTITWIKMPGQIYLRILTLTILPLIVSNIFVVIASLEPKKNGKISLIGISYIVCSNLIGSLIGTACAAIVQPGSRILIEGEESNTSQEGTGLSASDVFKDIFMNLFPDNIIGVAIFQYRTEVVNRTTNEKVGNSTTPGSNMIGVLFVAMTFGAAANAIGPVAEPILKFFRALSALVTKVMAIFLLLTPIGVCFMVAGSVLERKNIQSDFIQLGLFAVTVLLGLLIYFILTILTLLAASRKNPVRLLKYCVQPFFICFASTSVPVAMGEMYKQLDMYGCNEMASRFVIPICCAMKGDTPAIFITSACMFVVQQSGVEVDASKIIFIILLTFTSTLAIPKIPSASMVLVVTVLSSVGIPSQAASMLYAMEWLLDRCRSGVSGISAMYIANTTSEIYERIKPVDDEDARKTFDEEEEERSIADRNSASISVV